MMKQAILYFRRDDEGDWIAELACGHHFHVRHRPPLVDRAWVLTAAGRQRFVGVKVHCRVCTGEAPESV